jgi:D-glycero-D-manno-heptose 1,7-bisphosphate phosphatase
MRREAVFLDRDGVINEELGYLGDSDQLRLIPGAAEAIRKLNEAHLLTIAVTNQAGVARGYYPESKVTQVHEALNELLAQQGARIDRFYYCPHHPTEGIGRYRKDCDCRKPKPGMLYRAAEDLSLNLGDCFLVGDKISDIQAGVSAGCKTLLVLTGYGKIHQFQIEASGVQIDHIAPDLLRAVERILEAYRLDESQ